MNASRSAAVGVLLVTSWLTLRVFDVTVVAARRRFDGVDSGDPLGGAGHAVAPGGRQVPFPSDP
jgi:hypothetical protein